MATTIPNIVVNSKTVVDIYADAGVIAAGITVGSVISVRMIGDGEAQLYSGASLVGRPTDATGFMPIYERESYTNESGDLGAFIWSEHGCTINVKAG